MAKKAAKKRSKGKARKAKARSAKARAKHVKRGCGKRNWRKGDNAYWRCKVGKKHAYKTRAAK